VATPARASTPIFSGTYTGGNNFSTVASVSLSYDFVSNGVYLFTLDVMNQGSFGELYKIIGLFNLPGSFSLQSYDCGSWVSGATVGGAGRGVPEKTTGCQPASHPRLNGLFPGQGTTFSFQIGGFTSLNQVNGVGAGLDAVDVDGADGCRQSQLGVQGGAVLREGTCGPTPQVQTFTTLLAEPTTVVPEPSSVILLATGLLGLLGFAYVRRRRGLPLVQDMA
jgi:hypothetical protein